MKKRIKHFLFLKINHDLGIWQPEKETKTRNGDEKFRKDRGEVWTQDIVEWMGVSTVKAGRQALERGQFRQAVWEATSIKDPP